jgi:hypothetical protein
MAIAASLRRDHHWSGNFLQDGGEEIYRNGTAGSNPACSSGESAANLIFCRIPYEREDPPWL